MWQIYQAAKALIWKEAFKPSYCKIGTKGLDHLTSFFFKIKLIQFHLCNFILATLRAGEGVPSFGRRRFSAKKDLDGISEQRCNDFLPKNKEVTAQE